MTYNPPVAHMLHSFQHVAELNSVLSEDVPHDLVETILEEAAKFAAQQIAPHNHSGDKAGVKLHDGVVTMPKGWKQLYKDWCEAGWNGVYASPDFGGQGLPCLINSACIEMWNAANPSFGIGPVLTCGAIEALTAHGSDALKAKYLPKMISGEWTGTMNLTEPSSGSDLSGLRSKAVNMGDGTYKITGQKIFITWGEHDLTDNIIHLVLARLPDAPAGTKGISLFLVPKFLEDGTRNDARCHSVEHKLGLHASPTCTMVFGDNGGATGYLIGEENRGLNCMFTMMNNARLAVALQGVAVADRATQQAKYFATQRVQGKATGVAGNAAIIHHKDVQRMLLTMEALTRSSRAICYRTAVALDQGHAGDKAASQRAALLTPVAKAYSTDNGIEVASLGVQVHGGMGYIEETGAAQHLRDARIYAIYEGTNGIQAIDLVTRKLPLEGGDVMRLELSRMRETLAKVQAKNTPEFGRTALNFARAIDDLSAAFEFLLAALGSNPDAALAGATPFTRLFGFVAGNAALIEEALAGENTERVQLARFMAEHLLPQSTALREEIVYGAESVMM